MALVLEGVGLKTCSPPMPQHQKNRQIENSLLKVMWEWGWGAGGLGSWELGAGKLGAGELGSSEMWSWKLVSWGAGELGPTLTHPSGECPPGQLPMNRPKGGRYVSPPKPYILRYLEKADFQVFLGGGGTVGGRPLYGLHFLHPPHLARLFL